MLKFTQSCLQMCTQKGGEYYKMQNDKEKIKYDKLTAYSKYYSNTTGTNVTVNTWVAASLSLLIYVCIWV